MWKVLMCCVQLFVTPWTVSHQPPLSMEFSRQAYWSGCHFLLQGIFPIQGLNQYLLYLPYWQADSFTTSTTWEAPPKQKGFVCFWCVATPQGMWDLSFLTRTRNRAPCSGRQSFNHWPTWEAPPQGGRLK